MASSLGERGESVLGSYVESHILPIWTPSMASSLATMFPLLRSEPHTADLTDSKHGLSPSYVESHILPMETFQAWPSPLPPFDAPPLPNTPPPLPATPPVFAILSGCPCAMLGNILSIRYTCQRSLLLRSEPHRRWRLQAWPSRGPLSGAPPLPASLVPSKCLCAAGTPRSTNGRPGKSVGFPCAMLGNVSIDERSGPRK